MNYTVIKMDESLKEGSGVRFEVGSLCVALTLYRD
jgi:hypothetical protein